MSSGQTHLRWKIFLVYCSHFRTRKHNNCRVQICHVFHFSFQRCFFSSAFFFSFQGPVYRLQWSPFLSDAFLSCSADWSIRLWHQDKPQPIMTFISSTVSLKLKEIQSWWTSRTALHSSFSSSSVWPSLVYFFVVVSFQKSVNDVCWCPSSATLFACVNDKAVEIWDLSVSM